MAVIPCYSFLSTEMGSEMPFVKKCRHNIATENKTTLHNPNSIKMKKSVLVFGFLLVNAAAFVSCNREEQNPNPVSAAQRNLIPLSGRIVNENGEGISGVLVSACNHSVISGPTGFFRLNVERPESKIMCMASKSGFQDGLLELNPDKNQEGLNLILTKKADGNSPAICQLQVNGDGFGHETIEFGNIPSSSIGIFSGDGQNTYFSMSSKNGYSIAGVFPGQAAGVSSKKSSMTFIAYGKTYVADADVEISVKEYGEIGQKIIGTFSGTFKRYDVDLKTGKNLEYIIQVEKGNFEVIRQANI